MASKRFDFRETVMESPRFGGYLPDPAKKPGEKPDWIFRSLSLALGATPPAADFSDKVQEILDQGRLGSCVANAGMLAIQLKNSQSLGSRLWGYYLARSTHGSEDSDSGTYLRAFFDVVNKYGFLPESKYKHGYDTTKFAIAPPPLAFRLAFDQKSPLAYYRIDTEGNERIADIKSAIAAGHPVVFGTDVGYEFVDLMAHTCCSDPPTGNIAGGHAMCIVGYSETGFKVANSWGTDWGNSGFGLMSNAYLAWERTRDIWAVVQAPGYSE